MPGKLATKRHFCPLNPIHPGITPGTAALDADLETRYESQVHEVLGDGNIQLQFAYDGTLPNLEVRQSTDSCFVLPLAPEYEVENHFQFHLYSNPIGKSGKRLKSQSSVIFEHWSMVIPNWN